ncbi:rna polymerase sporulation specific sigma factor sigf [hydrocarbon metagenome]|uniref:Rna polymerase sporulation specific sigma factor sigf n=1 Tax=hydrocarbon metagenome TaxID=938273 RepID=A0A0W8E811_9ZZZZ
MSSLNPYEENEKLIAMAQAGDESARAQVHEANIGLVYMVLEKFKNTSYEYEDLFQVGSIGLLKAVDKFDFNFNVRFSTYAVPMIIGEIKKFLRDDGIVKVQRGIKETYSKIRWAQDKLRGELGREPGVDEIGLLLGMDKEEIVMSIEACQVPAYINDVLPREENDNLSMLDRLTASESSAVMLEKIALREALSTLDEREREVILRRYFKDETQSLIAGDLGVSQVQISRIEKTAIKKLKTILE